MIAEEHELSQNIPLAYHFQMLMSKERMSGFREAILAVVPQGGRVLELGGGTGVLSFFAAQKAAKVWCVERLASLARKARELLEQNPHTGQIEVVTADAMEYLPPEPVDVVICEMLHSALLREKQVEVIASFKKRYLGRFGGRLPVFIPEATVLGIQPVNQNFDFFGYRAPVSLFESSAIADFYPVPLGQPVVYSIIQYGLDLPASISYDGKIGFDQPGSFNALRFITSNVLTINLSTKAAINWANQNLVLPLPVPMEVRPGITARVRFNYIPGSSIESLTAEIRVTED